jgi:nucleoside-diphosphate-sugar epimerase
MKTVGIIGGAGFIGSYNTQKFLNEGYNVKVSTTDISNKGKYEHLHNFKNAENLEVVQLDVENKVELSNFLEGCEVVIHGGTPFQLDVKDPKTELFDPTIKGTENFLEAIQQADGIEKVIFIASVAAYNTNHPMLPDGKTYDKPISESDEPFTSEQSHPYAQAKFIANQSVNKFIVENQDLSFEIVSVSPVGVMGKSLSNREDSTSMGLQFLFKNKIAPNPFVQMLYDTDVNFAVVDVEDVADAIYKAALTEGIHGKNYLLSSESYKVSDTIRMLNQEQPVEKPTMTYSNELAKHDLGISFKPAQVTLNSYAS